MQLPLLLSSLLIMLFSLGHLGRISLYRQEVNFYAYEVVLIILTIFLTVSIKKLTYIPILRIAKIIVYFLIYLLVSFLISAHNFTIQQNITGLLYFLRLSLYLIFMIVFSQFIFLHKSDKRTAKFAVISISIFLVLTVIISFGQLLFYPDIRNILYAGWDPHLNRAVGVFFEPPVSGAVYGMLLIYFLLYKNTHKRVSIITLLFLFILLLLTFSRGTYVAFVITLLLIFIRYLTLQKIYIISFFLIFVIGLFAATRLPGEGSNLTRISTVSSRLVNYREAVQLWQRSPITGVGYNHIRYVRVEKAQALSVQDLSHAESAFHSSFLVILVSGGIIGLVLFIYLLIKISQLGRFANTLVVFLSFASFTDNVFLHPFVLFLFASLISLSFIHPSDKLR